MTTFTVQRYNGTSWEDIDYRDWQIDHGIHTVSVAPSATVVATTNATVNAADPIRIRVDGSTLFKGDAVTSGSYSANGRREIPVKHKAARLFRDRVDVSKASRSDKNHLSTALSNADLGGSFTLTFNATASSSFTYGVSNRKLKAVFRDIMDRSALVFRVDLTADEIIVDDRGAGASFGTFDTSTDDVKLESWDGSNTDTVRNEVTVNGTGDVNVSATATDSTSISTYGRQSAQFNYAGVTTSSVASTLASELLIPDPLAEGTLRVFESAGSIYQSLANQQVTITDSPRNVSSETLTIEGQTIRQGEVVLQIGQGAGVDVDDANRGVQSVEDTTEPGSVVDNSRIADSSVDSAQLVDTSVIEAKLADAAVATAKLQSNAVINGKLDDLSVSETKVQDDAISTPKLKAGAVTASEIAADTITASEIASGTITATEIAADTITASEIAAATITATEIAAGTITANEINTLDLDASEITISNDPASPDSGIKFNTISGSPDEFEILPFGTDFTYIGSSTDPFGEGWFKLVDTPSIDNVEQITPAAANVDVEYVDDGSGNPVVRPGVTGGSGQLGESGQEWQDIFSVDGSIDNFRTDEWAPASKSFTEKITVTVDANNNTSFFPTGATAGDGKGQVGGSSAPFNEIHGEAYVGSGSTNALPEIIPNNDQTGSVGKSGNAWQSMRSDNFITNSPEPVTAADRQAYWHKIPAEPDGQPRIDLDELTGCSWYDPPEYIKREQRDRAAGDTDGHPDDHGVELGTATNYVLEVCKRQQDVIADLSARLDDLAARVEHLEATDPNA